MTLTKEHARRRLLESRKDIERAIARSHASLAEQHRALQINTELYEGITHETPPPLGFDLEELLEEAMAS